MEAPEAHQTLPSRPRRRPSNTLLLCLSILAMTAASALLSPDWKTIDSNAIIALGANFPQATFDGFGLWRLLAARVQAGTWQALALLLPFLWVVSGAFERTYGRTLHALMFVASSLLAGTATLLFASSAHRLSVGAGAPALAFAACLLMAMATREAGAPRWRSLFSWRALLVLPYLVSTGMALAARQADTASLVAGAAAGALAGLVLPTVGQPRGAQAKLRVASACGAALALVVAGLAAAPRPPYYWSEAVAFADTAREYAADMDVLNKQFDTLTQAALAGNMSQADLGARLAADAVPKWREAQRKWEPLLDHINPAVPDGAKAAPMKAYVASRAAFIEAAAKAWTTDDAEAIAAAVKHREALERAQAAMAR